MILRSAVAVLILAVALYVALQTSVVQTYIADKALSSLNESIAGKVHVGRIYVNWLNNILLQDVTVLDGAKRSPEVSDTLFHAEKIVLQYTFRGLFSKEGPQISRVAVTGGGINLVLEDDEVPVDGKYYNTNLTRIFGLDKYRDAGADSSDTAVAAADTAEAVKSLFRLKNVRIKDFAFNMYDLTKDVAEQEAKGGINWRDMNISDIYFDIKDMEMTDGVIRGRMAKGSFRERSGFNCRNISGTVRVGGGLTSIDALRIEDDYSDLRIGNYSMMYDSTKDFSDYIRKVAMSISFPDTCRLNMRTIGFFAPSLEGLDLDVSLYGGARGTVDSLYAAPLVVRLDDYGTAFTLYGGMKGLPDIGASCVEASIDSLKSDAAGISALIAFFTGREAPAFLEAVPEGEIVFKGDFSGMLDALAVRAGLSSPSGNVGLDVAVKGLMGDALTASGTVSAENLDAGKMLSTDIVGTADLEARFSVSLEEGRLVYADLDDASVSKLVAGGYAYSGINVSGHLEDGLFNASVVSSDPNLSVSVDASGCLDSLYAYGFVADVRHADLNALNIDKRGRSVVSFRAESDFGKTAAGEIDGTVAIDGLVLENEAGAEDIGAIRLEASSNPRNYAVTLESDFLDAEFSGTASLARFIKDFQALTTGISADALCPEDALVWSGNIYDLAVTTGNSMGVCSFIRPGLYVAEGSGLSLHVGDAGEVEAELSSQRIALGENYLKDLTFKATNPDSTLDCVLRTSEARAASVLFDNPRLSLAVLDNSAYVRLSYSDPGRDSVNSGQLNFRTDFIRDTLDGKLSAGIRVGSSEFYVNGGKWSVAPATVMIADRSLVVDSLTIGNGPQSICVNTSGSGAGSDTLTVSLSMFDVSALNPVIGGGYDLRGEISGYASLTDIFEDPGLLMDIRVDSVSVAGIEAGNLDIMSRWDETNKRFSLYLQNEIDGKHTVNTTGFLRPKDKYLSMNMRLDGLPAGYFAPALESVLSDISGSVSGHLSLSGNLDRLVLRSRRLSLEDVLATIAYTNVTYRLNGALSANEAGISVNDILVEDFSGHRGILSGNIGYEYFRNMDFDVELKFSGLECIDVPMGADRDFYGTAFATGRLFLQGPLDRLSLSADARTMPGTMFHIPVGSVSDAGNSQILTFKDYSPAEEESDPYDLMLSRLGENKAGGASLAIDLHLNVTSDASVFVELDETSGSGFRGQGTGTVDITVGGDSGFGIRGDYTVGEGDFRFSVGGLVARDFTIDEGSTVRFNGDIMESDLNINAIYTTKTSLGTLIADTSSVSSRRTVNCLIGISGKLSNPNLRFDIDIPDIDPMVRSRVESALSTDDKIQKQFLSLLMSNSFIPDEQSSIVNNSSLLFSNVSEVLSGQLSSIFQKFEIPLDLGVNYQQSDTGTDIFDVAVSTQLFNNRVIVNGNIGNRQNSVTGNNGVAGDIDIEIKLDRKGVLRLNLFSHSADQYSSYLDQSQRSGVGITYQQEFSTFKELWQKMFWSRKRKRAAEEEELRLMMEQPEDKEEMVLEVE